jgi:hypothetical protein
LFWLAVATSAGARAGDDIADAGLFTLHSSDLTGPIAIPPGQGIWRTAAIRNTSQEFRLTIGLAGSGPHAAWVVPATDQVELAPGQLQLVRFSITPPTDARGTADLGLGATLLDARSVLIIGESPVVTAQRRELAFRVEVAALGATEPVDGDAATTTSDATIATAEAVDFGRIAGGFVMFAVILGVAVTAPKVLRRKRVRPDRVEQPTPTLASFTDERLAVEATRQLAGRVGAEDRDTATKVRVRNRIDAKAKRRAAARAATLQQLDLAQAAEIDRHRFAESTRAQWVHVRTQGARARMNRAPTQFDAPAAGAEPLAFEADIVERPVAPRPVGPRHDPATADSGAAALATQSKPKRQNRRRQRVDVLALDVERLNQALDERRTRDAFDARSESLSAR